MATRVRIIFKNGHVEEFVVDKFTMTRGAISNHLSEIGWAQSGEAPFLEFVRVDEIVCITSSPIAEVSKMADAA